MRWLKKLWQRIRKWWKKRGAKRPGSVTNVKQDIDMAKNVTITWDLPTQRDQGGALQPQDIDYVQVNMSADAGANYTELARVPAADPQSVFIPDLEIGTWLFQIRVMDRLGQFDRTPHEETVEVIDDSPPGPVTNVQVTQE